MGGYCTGTITRPKERVRGLVKPPPPLPGTLMGPGGALPWALVGPIGALPWALVGPSRGPWRGPPLGAGGALEGPWALWGPLPPKIQTSHNTSDMCKNKQN